MNGSQCRVSIRTRLAPKLGIFDVCNKYSDMRGVYTFMSIWVLNTF